jgi:prolyl oligopeptidase
MDGYGGFGTTLSPGYSGVLGRLWLPRGGTYVLANIRGGGDYGPDRGGPAWDAVPVQGWLSVC